MPKATIKLPNGTFITIDGSKEEIQDLLQLYSQGNKHLTGKDPEASLKTKAQGKSGVGKQEEAVDLAKIVNLVKNSDEAEAIEVAILDRGSSLDRTLLPLYIIHEKINSADGLTSGEISKITKDLGVPVSQPNVSIILSGAASKFVIGNAVRKRGKAIRYRISRRGIQYLKSLLDGSVEKSKRAPRKFAKPAQKSTKSAKTADSSKVKADNTNVLAMVESIRHAKNYAEIEKNILSKSDQLGRVLLCCYFAYQEFNKISLSANDIVEMTDQLGNRVVATNVSKTMRLRGKKYLTSESPASDGGKRFKINLKGIKAFEKIVNGEKP
jgi:hypothetical protein